MTEIHGITPMLYVDDVDEAAKLLSDCLGFEVFGKLDGYRHLRRGPARIRLIKTGPDIDLSALPQIFHTYIDVEDVDAMYDARRAAIEALPEGSFRPPFDRHYGQREFHILYGPYLFFVGQGIPGWTPPPESSD